MTDRARPCRVSPLAAALALLLGCTPGAPQPAELDTRNEQCASCRMAVSDARFAAQVVAPGEVARFFDDLGCLRTFLTSGKAPAGAVAFVADHRTKEWVRLEQAVVTRVPGLETPMSSHLIAHAGAASRDQDEDARGGSPVPVAEVGGGL
jgi:copper chaperone NosL